MNFTLNNQLTPVKMITVMLLAFAVFVTSSCKKDDPDTVTEEDAVDLMESTLSSEDDGFMATASNAARLATEQAGSCLSGDSTFTSAYSGTLRSYSFDAQWNWTVVCDQLIPQTFTLSASTEGSYSGSRLDYSGQSTSSFVVSNIVSGDLTVDATASQSAAVTITARDNRSFDSDVTVTLSDIILNRLTFEIQSGTGTVNVAATTGDGSSFEFAADIVFLGGGSATVTVNGNDYTISI